MKQGVDYVVVYNGTGEIKDAQGNPVHVLNISILNPQPVMYILDYDATLVIPPGTTEAVSYSNSASISLWGKQFQDNSVNKFHADINISAQRYQVDIHKTDSQTGKPLPGATFGLFNAEGGLITTEVTDAEGDMNFVTDIANGIILREHVLYYVQELSAPPGYQLDDKQFWICFCNIQDASCTTCDDVIGEIDVYRIPFEKIGKVDIANDHMNYSLPSTGGTGITPFILVGVLFIPTPLVYGFVRRRKQERRNAE